MDIAKELEDLERLHERGTLNDAEFAKAKDAVLRGTAAPDGSLGTAANRYVTFQIVMSGIGVLIFLLVFVMVFLPRLNAFPGP